MTTTTTTPKAIGNPIADFTVPGTKVRITISYVRLFSKTQVYYMVDEYVDTRRTWSKIFYVETAARDAANQRWTNAIAIRNAKKVAAEVTRPEITEGYWEISGVVYKVQLNLAGTGIYAKRLDVDSDGTREWTYCGWQGMRDLREHGTKVQGDTVKKYGKLYGACMICGRRLTNEESISEGIGPVCSGKVQW
jgi:hypothetical protein